MTVRSRRVRAARRAAIGVVVLGLLGAVVVAGGLWRASWIINGLLRDWAAGMIAQESNGVYRLDLSRVHFDWTLGRVAIDTIALSTHRGVNERHLESIPGLSLVFHTCTVSGIHLITLIRNGGLIARSVGCREGTMVIEVPRSVRVEGPQRPGPAPAGPAFADRHAFLVFQQGVRLPSYAPRVHIDRVIFPRLALDVRLRRTARGAGRLQLERLQWTMADVVIDPADTLAAARPLFSRKIDLVATNFTTHPGHHTVLSIGVLRTSLTDSTMEVRDVGYAPSARGAAAALRGYDRPDLVKLSVGRIAAQGIDFGAFLVGLGVRARRVEVDSLRIDVAADKRQPDHLIQTRHLTPQQWIADLDETLRLDSLRVRNGRVTYREHASGRLEVGVFTFGRIEASATNVSHLVGRRTSGDPMTLTARAQLQNVGQLDVRVVVPLDAPQFDMTFRGTLGAMPATAFNQFVLETDRVEIENGQVAGVGFDVAVRNGVAQGTITPRFNDLSVRVTKRGAGTEGMLARGGILGGAARGVATFAAKMMLRANNPDQGGNEPRVGAIGHTFTTDETLVAFLWSGVREGLLTVVKK